MKTTAALGPLVAVAVAGCAPSVAYFRPSEQDLTRTPEGYAEATYDLQGEAGTVGEARVWSAGVRERDDTLRVEVGVRLENPGRTPLVVVLDSLRLLDVRVGDVRLEELAPSATAGTARVEPGRLGEITAVFELPAAGAPRDVLGFTLRWAVSIDEQPTSQFTAFTREERVGYGPVYAGALYPYWYGPPMPWRFGAGLYFYGAPPAPLPWPYAEVRRAEGAGPRPPARILPRRREQR